MADAAMVTLRLLGPGDDDVLQNVAPDVFDHAVDPRWTAEFLADPRHHLAVALDDGLVVGMASAVHYVHPDKAPELFVIEVGVALTHLRQGLAKRLLGLLWERGRAVGCAGAWVGTETTNTAARRLYASAGGTEDPDPFVVYWFDFAGGA